MVRIPKCFQCPRCNSPFIRGRRSLRYKCPYCRSVFYLWQVKNFYRWRDNGSGVVKIRRPKIVDRIKERYIKNVTQKSS